MFAGLLLIPSAHPALENSSQAGLPALRLAFMTLRNSLTQMRRANYEFAGNARYSKPALNDLDRKLGRYLMRRRGIFVEAGANHAFTQSNPYYLQRFLGWSGLLGLLVEAIPALYQRATRRRPHECSTAL